jgi:hypothetical protein
MDYGRAEYLQLIASKDASIQRLMEAGFEFVTNAFRSDLAPKGIRAKDVESLKQRLRQEGYHVEVAPAYNETGDPLPAMVSLWRKKRVS